MTNSSISPEVHDPVPDEMQVDVDVPLTPRRAMGSALWATGQQVILLGSSALFGILLARAVSVAEFGVFSYATALSTIGMALVTGGLSALAIKALIDHPKRQAHTVTALIFIREGMALAAYLVLLGVAFTSGSHLTIEATAIALLVLFARAWDALEFWFQSRLESQKSAVVRISVVLVMLGVRLVALALGASLWVFLALYVLESCFVALGFLWRYLHRATQAPGLAIPPYDHIRELMGRSWILLLSGVAAQIDLRADLVILQALLGSAAVGIYAAASRLSELTYFLPVVFMTATFPILLDARQNHGHQSNEYRAMLQRSYDQACWMGVLIMAAIWITGPWAIHLLYGARYAESGAILRIHVLALPFVFMSAVLSKWIIAEDVLMASLIRRGFAAAINIALNLALIPAMGLQGSAIATVVSYTFGSYFVCFLGKSMRPAAIQMSLAMVAPVRLSAQGFRYIVNR